MCVDEKQNQTAKIINLNTGTTTSAIEQKKGVCLIHIGTIETTIKSKYIEDNMTVERLEYRL